MSKQRIAIECQSCGGSGLYVGLAEQHGAAVVCSRCKGAGKDHIEFVRFTERQQPKKPVRRVHVSRGYVLSPDYHECTGGVPIEEWKPGMVVPADEQLYCPMIYTGQSYCAFKDKDGSARPGLGVYIPNCDLWNQKAECWAKFHADGIKGEVS